MQRQSLFPDLSFFKGRPILEAGADWEKPEWIPMSESWKQNFSSRFWATNFTGDLSKEVGEGTSIGKAAQLQHMKELLALRDVLLAFGGEQVCLPMVEDALELLQKYGEIWLPAGSTLKRGRTSQCHENARALAKASRGELRYATGYYLTDDGMWRPHSWCIRSTAKGGRVVETTNKALLYFGAISAD